MGVVRVFVADDHTLFREGLIALLSARESVVVVGDASTRAETAARVRAAQPDVILLDVEMPGTSVLDAIPDLKRLAPAAAIVVLTMHDDPRLEMTLRVAGAADFVSKSTATDELVERVRLASVRRFPMPRSAVTRVPLSSREVEVLRLIADGHSNADTAKRLFIAVGTVKRHLSQIYPKLEVHSRTQAVRAARLLGLLG